MGQDVTCSHCGNVAPDWLAPAHECAWRVWRQGEDEPTWSDQLWKGRTAEDAVCRWAFYHGDERRMLCRHFGTAALVYVRRKGSDEVTSMRVSGHFQPTYEAHAGSTIFRPSPKTEGP